MSDPTQPQHPIDPDTGLPAGQAVSDAGAEDVDPDLGRGSGTDEESDDEPANDESENG